MVHIKPAILITGGAGFIGSCLVRQLVSQGQHHVVTVDKLTYAGNLESLAEVQGDPNHDFVEADICDRAAMQRVFETYEPQGVYHLAAESHVDRSIEGPDAFLQTNVVGTFALLEQAYEFWKRLSEPARNAFRFLHISTDEVFGSLGAQGIFKEDSAYDPRSPYSASKAASDHFVRAFFHTYGLPILVTNSSNNYGPYQYPEKLIPLMILNVLEGKPLPLYGDGSYVRDWLFVEDHCRALQLVMRDGTVGETYNIGGSCERTNLEVVHVICDVVDRLCPDISHGSSRSLITQVADRPGHDYRYAIDPTKIKELLGWQPQVSFEEGFLTTVQWYLDNPDWITGVTSGKDYRHRFGLLHDAE